MFLTRLISGILLLIATFFTMYYGGYLLLFSLFTISIIGLFELYRVLKFERTLVAGIGYLSTVVWYLTLLLKDIIKLDIEIPSLLIISITLILLLLIFVFSYPKYSANVLFCSIFGVFYIPIMLSFIFMTREEIVMGAWLSWLVYISSWGSDTSAYIFGRLFGRHKLAKILSPKKSIEGAIGGIVGSSLIGFVFGLFLCKIYSKSIDLAVIVSIICGIGSIISQIGDLAASGIKRNFDIKDYGKIIPGHGGILDRYDSIIITSPIIYYLSFYLLGKI